MYIFYGVGFFNTDHAILKNYMNVASKTYFVLELIDWELEPAVELTDTHKLELSKQIVHYVHKNFFCIVT